MTSILLIISRCTRSSHESKKKKSSRILDTGYYIFTEQRIKNQSKDYDKRNALFCFHYCE